MNEDVVIERDDDYRRLLLDKLKGQMGIGVRRTGVHVSDLIMCTRKAWSERILGDNPERSDQTVLTWLRGLSHEAIVAEGVEQVRAGYCFQCKRNFPWTPDLSDTNLCPVCGDTLMVGTIDWVQLLESGETHLLEEFIPVEMKSTMKSSRKTLEAGDMGWFVDQIKSYMAMHQRKKGRVAILHVSGDYSRPNKDIRSDGPEAELRVYSVRWRSEHDAANWLTTLQARKQMLEDDHQMPKLDQSSPAHPMICSYCDVGEKLPNGLECENWPWRYEPTTEQYVKKGSSIRAMGMDEMAQELEKMQARHDEEQLKGLNVHV